MGDNPFAIAMQAVGTLMVAALLWQLTHLIPARFLRYWSLAWVCLSLALFAMRLTRSNLVVPSAAPLGLSLFLMGEYCFGFLLWAGFRDYASNRALSRGDLYVILPFLPLAIAAPWLVREEWLLPVHTVLMSGFFAASFWVSLGIVRRSRRPAAGLTIVRMLLAGLTVIFFLYGPLHAASFMDTFDSETYRLSHIYYSLIQLGLAFGLVVMAAERANESLELRNEELSEVSRRDALTGLYNRRHFDAFLSGKQELSEASGALAVIDVNDLKLINDCHLHPAGDAVLKLVARSLVGRFRVNDPIFRVGGDEFVVMMLGCSAADLAARMADVDDSLMNLRVPGIAEPIDIRIAWGLATFTKSTSIAAAYEGADQAMYACKTRRKAGAAAVS